MNNNYEKIGSKYGLFYSNKGDSNDRNYYVELIEEVEDEIASELEEESQYKLKLEYEQRYEDDYKHYPEYEDEYDKKNYCEDENEDNHKHHSQCKKEHEHECKHEEHRECKKEHECKHKDNCECKKENKHECKHKDHCECKEEREHECERKEHRECKKEHEHECKHRDHCECREDEDDCECKCEKGERGKRGKRGKRGHKGKKGKTGPKVGKNNASLYCANPSVANCGMSVIFNRSSINGKYIEFIDGSDYISLRAGATYLVRYTFTAYPMNSCNVIGATLQLNGVSLSGGSAFSIGSKCDRGAQSISSGAIVTIDRSSEYNKLTLVSEKNAKIVGGNFTSMQIIRLY